MAMVIGGHRGGLAGARGSRLPAGNNLVGRWPGQARPAPSQQAVLRGGGPIAAGREAHCPIGNERSNVLVAGCSHSGGGGEMEA